MDARRCVNVNFHFVNILLLFKICICLVIELNKKTCMCFDVRYAKFNENGKCPFKESVSCSLGKIKVLFMLTFIGAE